MRPLLAALLFLIAVPAYAAQERECRGKTPFDFGNGVSGCLLDLGAGEITSTRTRDDGASSSSRQNVVGQIRVLLFGNYDGSKQVVRQRVSAVCKAFLPQLKAEMGDKRFHRVTVVLIWPRVANPGDFVPTATSKVAIQPAFSSSACRGVKFFS